MLVLSRKPNERFVMVLPDGKEIWITILESRSTKCRIGIDAGDDVVIAREELLEKKELRN